METVSIKNLYNLILQNPTILYDAYIDSEESCDYLTFKELLDFLINLENTGWCCLPYSSDYKRIRVGIDDDTVLVILFREGVSFYA